jgi:hypothetical protein
VLEIAVDWKAGGRIGQRLAGQRVLLKPCSYAGPRKIGDLGGRRHARLPCNLAGQVGEGLVHLGAYVLRASLGRVQDGLALGG